MFLGIHCIIYTTALSFSDGDLLNIHFSTEYSPGGYRGRGGYGGGGGGGYRGGEENHNNFGMRRDRRDSDRERPERGRHQRQPDEFREATAG